MINGQIRTFIELHIWNLVHIQATFTLTSLTYSCQCLQFAMRAPREYYKRLDPLSFYTDRKFIKRYRLSKTVVRVIIRCFLDDMPPKKRVVVGKHGVPHRLRVSVTTTSKPMRHVHYGINTHTQKLVADIAMYVSLYTHFLLWSS